MFSMPLPLQRKMRTLGAIAIEIIAFVLMFFERLRQTYPFALLICIPNFRQIGDL
jgi:hypothetical protein